MANYYDIKCMPKVNKTDDKIVNQLVQSILKNGYLGEPIYYCEMGLITGSHRLTALQTIDDSDFDNIYDILNNDDIAIDITDIINQYCENKEICFEELPFDDFNNYTYDDFEKLI